MGVIDTIGNAFDSAKDITGTGLGIIVDTAKASASMHLNFEDYVKDVAAPVSKRVGRFYAEHQGTAHNSAQLGAAVNAAYSYGVARPLSTVEQVTGVSPVGALPSLIAKGIADPSSLGDFFKSDEWKQAWGQSSTVTPGQAAVTNSARFATTASGSNAVERGFGINGLSYAKIAALGDPHSDDYDSKFSFASGAVDAALSWYADPLVVAGKASKAARIAKTELRATNEDRAAMGLSTATEDLSRRGKRIRSVKDRFIAETDNYSAHQLIEMDAFSKAPNGAALASLFAENKGDHELKNLIWSTAAGNQETRAVLAQRRADIVAKIDRVTEDIESMKLTYAGASDNARVATMNSDEAIKKAEDELKANERMLDMYNRALSAEGGVSTIPRISTLDKARAADAKHYVLRDGPLGMPIRVARSNFDRVSTGVVSYHDAEAGAIKMRDMSRRVRGMDPATRQKHVERWLNAPDDNARKLAYDAFRDQALKHMGKSLGYTDEELRHIVQLNQEAGSTAFNVLKSRAYAASTEDGRRVDLIQLPDETWAPAPLDTVQLANSDPVMPIDEIFRALKRSQPRVAALRHAGASAQDIADSIGDTLNDVWRFAVLARLGYGVRNLTDNQIRMASKLGGLQWASMHLESAGGYISNKRAAVPLGQLRQYTKDELAKVEKEIAAHTATKPAEPMVRVYRGSHEPLDLGRVNGQGLRVTRDRSYAEENGGTNFLYELDIPESAFPRTQLSDALGDGPLPHTFIDRETAAKARLIRAPEGHLAPPRAGHQRLYHAAPEDFQTFREPGRTDGMDAPGLYFSTSEQKAKGWARDLGPQAKVLPFDVRLDNARKMHATPADGGFPKDALEAVWHGLVPDRPFPITNDRALSLSAVNLAASRAGVADEVIGRKTRDVLEGLGYDGILEHDAYGSVIAFRPKQAVRARAAEVHPEQPIPDGHVDHELASLLDDKARLEAALEAIPTAPRTGQGYDKFGSYTTERAMGVEDTDVDLNRQLSSSEGLLLNLALSEEHRLKQTMRGSGDYQTIAGHREDGSPNMAWGPAYLRVVNQHFRQGEIRKRLLAGDSEEKVVRWLKSAEGRETRRRLVHRGDSAERIVHANVVEMNHVLPPEHPIRALAAERPLTKADVERAFPDPSTRPAVNAEAIKFAAGEGTAAVRAYGKARDGWFKLMDTFPEDAFARHPFYRKLYTGRRNQMIAQADPHLTGTLSDEQLRVIETNARQWARREMKSVLFDVSSKSTQARFFRFIAPFYAAWQDTLTKYGRLAVNNPALIRHAQMIWTAPNKAGAVVVVDKNGHPVPEDRGPVQVVDKDGNPVSPEDSHFPNDNEYLQIGLPKFMADHFSVGQVRIPKSSVNLVLQGDPWWLPGFGPVAQVPVNEIVKRKPEWADAVKFILPWGPVKNSSTLFAPGAVKNALASQGNDVRYANSMTMIALTEMQKIAEGKREMPKGGLRGAAFAQEIEDRTNRFWKLRVATSLLAPVSVQYQSPYQFYVDEWHRFLEEDPKTASEKFLKTYGDDFYKFSTSLSQNNTGIQSTVHAHKAYKRLKDLVAVQPDLGWMVLGPDNKGDFSPAVYVNQQMTPVKPGSSTMLRGSQDPWTAIDKNNADLGWSKYTAMMDKLDVALAQRGLHSYQQRGAEDLAYIKAGFTADLKKSDPAWADDFDSRDESKLRHTIGLMQKLVSDPRTKDRADVRAMGEYLSFREKVSSVLAQRKAAGGAGTLSAQENADLAYIWAGFTNDLTTKYVTFAPVYHRLLETDDLGSASG